MAIYHMSMKTLSRSKGKSAVAAAAYRAGVLLYDEGAGKPADYRRKSGIAGSFITLPPQAPGWMQDRAMLWNMAEWSEKRHNSTVARELEVALPVELPAAGREQLVRDLCLLLVERYGVAVDAAIHLPGRKGDQRNHHAHILFTTRAVTETGFGKKTRILDDRKTGAEEVKAIRTLWADMVNKALAAVGTKATIDHRSHRDRGLDVPPQIHAGVNATGAARRGAKIISFPVLKRDRIIDYPAIDHGQTRTEYNAEIINLQKYREPETTAETVARLTAQLADTASSIGQLEVLLGAGYLPDNAYSRIRLALEYLRMAIARKAFAESEYIRKVEDAKAAKRQLRDQLDYQERLQSLLQEAQKKLEEERGRQERNKALSFAIDRMIMTLIGLPPHKISLEVPLSAQFKEASYSQNLKTMTTANIESALFTVQNKPPPLNLATVNLRQDVLQVKELLSRTRPSRTTSGRQAPQHAFRMRSRR